jgi:hypothetical protein
MLPTKHLSGAQKSNKRKRENQLIESRKVLFIDFSQLALMLLLSN